MEKVLAFIKVDDAETEIKKHLKKRLQAC